MTSLYALHGHYLQIQNLIENGEDIHPDNLEAITDAIEDKLHGYGMIIKNLQSDVDGIDAEIKRLANKKKSVANNIKRLKDDAEQAMTSTGQRKIKSALFSFNIQNNPPSVSVGDETLIPKGYFIEQQPTLNKKELLEDLKRGVDVPGAEMVQTESLRIR